MSKQHRQQQGSGIITLEVNFVVGKGTQSNFSAKLRFASQFLNSQPPSWPSFS